MECFACEDGTAALKRDLARTWVECSCGAYKGRGCDLSDAKAEVVADDEWLAMKLVYQGQQPQQAPVPDMEPGNAKPGDVQGDNKPESNSMHDMPDASDDDGEILDPTSGSDQSPDVQPDGKKRKARSSSKV